MTYTPEKIENMVIGILKGKYKESHHKPYEDEVTKNTLINEFWFDSLDLIEIPVDLEKNFGITMTAEEEEKIVDYKTKVSDIVKFVQTKLEAQPQPTNVPNTPTSKPVPQPETTLKQKLQGTDLSALAGKTVKLNGYEIIIRKIAQDTKIKGK